MENEARREKDEKDQEKDGEQRKIKVEERRRPKKDWNQNYRAQSMMVRPYLSRDGQRALTALANTTS